MKLFKAAAAATVALSLFLLGSTQAAAQFREDAFSQSYNNDPSSMKDSTDVLFSFKEFFGGLGHKNEIKIGTMFAGSLVFVGSSQIYNRDYWKLPIVYGGIGAGLTAGFILNGQGNQTAATWSFVAAGVTYWAALMDGVLRYKPSEFPHPGKATLFSVLVPGLGQIYNGEAWKLPLYYGIIGGGLHFFSLNRTNYLRYQRIYREMTDNDPSNDGPVSAETALYYRDVYRRYRDYSVLVILGGYLLQVIDANVFSYMHDFNVSDDLAVKVAPALIPPSQNALAFNPVPAVGLHVGLTF